MEIIPAIDLINQSCVRLVEGNFNRQSNYSTDPVGVAKSYEEIGIKRLHVVDLEGAKAGESRHLGILRRICGETRLVVDFGGGIRTRDQVEQAIDAGAHQVSLGSLAVKHPEKLQEWINAFGPERFFLGADVRDGFIATQAWMELSEMTWQEFIKKWSTEGVLNFFCTDIKRDGKLSGPASQLYRSMLDQNPSISLVASGGVSDLADLLELQSVGVSGVIIGKAIYEGRITLDELKDWIKNAS